MEQVTVTVQRRDNVGSRSSKVLRDQGLVPAVLYGHGEESIPLTLPQKTMEHCLKHHIRIMKLDFGKANEQVLVKDLQWDTFGEVLLHVDLIRVRMDEVVSMPVSLSPKGRAKGVDEGGILEIHKSEMVIKCLPSNIPDTITFDVSDLNIQDSIHIKDIQLPEGTTLDDDPEQVVASVAARVEVVEEEKEVPEGEEGEETSPEEGEKKEDKGNE